MIWNTSISAIDSVGIVAIGGDLPACGIADTGSSLSHGVLRKPTIISDGHYAKVASDTFLSAEFQLRTLSIRPLPAASYLGWYAVY
jgi:hypothetical protein